MTCRHCLAWKRRGPLMGACWQKAEAFPARSSETREDATCAEFTPKLATPVNPQMSSSGLCMDLRR